MPVKYPFQVDFWAIRLEGKRACLPCLPAGRHERGKTINSRGKAWNEVFSELKMIMEEIGK